MEEGSRKQETTCAHGLEKVSGIEPYPSLPKVRSWEASENTPSPIARPIS